jgi:hypothetical protein
MNSKKLAAIVALAVSAGLAGTGCMAQSDDEATDGQDQAAAPTAQVADAHSEKTGTASEKCGLGGFGGFGGCGLFGAGIPFWGGWGGCGIFGGPFYGGCGFGGGWGGCGGFGGCW